MELNSNELLIDLAKVGIGISFVPEFCLNSMIIEDENLIKIDVVDNVPERKLVVATSESSEKSDIINEFMQVLNVQELVV
jgi:DNA-binding transcriptional LysR family regulator